VRINVQLIDAATDEHLWAEAYDRQPSAANIFAIQSEIASSIAAALRATLSKDEKRRLDVTPTHNLAAVDSYFLGKQLLELRTRKSLFAAVEYFQQVIKLDPDFALGHSGLADASMLLPEYVADMDWRETWKKSESAAQRALTLDPDLPEALSSMGWNRLIHYYEWNEAEALLRRALEVQSNNINALHWLSHVLSWQARHEEALVLARRAVEVDPFSQIMRRNLSYILMDAADFDTAIEVAEENIRQFPNVPGQLGNLWKTQLRANRSRDAKESLMRWAALTGRDGEAAGAVGDAFISFSETRETQAVSRAVVDRIEFGSQDLGEVYAFLGDAEATLEALEQAFEERSGSRSVLGLKVNPGYDFIRGEPRFVALLQGVGLDD
jgi:tetratricopeptide (TPR) repeat protein